MCCGGGTLGEGLKAKGGHKKNGIIEAVHYHGRFINLRRPICGSRLH